MKNSSITKLFGMAVLAAAIASAQTGVSNSCADQSRTITGTEVAPGYNLCTLVGEVPDGTSMTMSTFNPEPINTALQMKTSVSSLPGVLGSYGISTWSNVPTELTTYTVSAEAYGGLNLTGYTSITVTVGANAPATIVGYSAIERIMNRNFTVQAGEKIRIQIRSYTNGTGFVYLSVAG